MIVRSIPAFVATFADADREVQLGFIPVQQVVGEARRGRTPLLVLRREGAPDRNVFTDRRGLAAARAWLRAHPEAEP